MTKKILLLAALPLSIDLAIAQSQWMPEATLFYNINAFDLENTGPFAPMTAPAEPGIALGMGYRINFKRQAAHYFYPSLGIRSFRQHLKISHAPGSQEISQVTFTNAYIYLKALVGFAILRSRPNHIELGMGISYIYSVSQSPRDYNVHYQDYTEASTGESYRYLESFYNYEWGDRRQGEERLIPSNFLFHLQAAYVNTTLLKNGRPLRLALELTSAAGSGISQSNRALAKSFNRQGDLLGTTVYKDYQASIGLNVRVGL